MSFLSVEEHSDTQCLLSKEGVNNANGSEVEPHLALSASTLNHPALRTHSVVLLPVQGHNVSSCVCRWTFMDIYMIQMCDFVYVCF